MDSRYICTAQSTRSELAIPLMVRDEVVGVLDCQSDQLDPFDKDTIELLTLFSTQASMALQNARLYTLERQRARQLEAINAIAQQSTAVLDLEELLSRVCCLIQQAFQVSHVSLFLRDEGELVLRAHHGTLTPRAPANMRFPAGQEPWSSILATSGSFIEKDLSGTPESLKFFVESASRLSIPLVSFGQTLGALTLDSSTPNAFRESELSSLESVADICATSIQNANYVERMKQLAYLDGLTGIFNRRFFELRIMEEIERARRYGTGMAVIMADIDTFKPLNDEFWCAPPTTACTPRSKPAGTACAQPLQPAGPQRAISFWRSVLGGVHWQVERRFQALLRLPRFLARALAAAENRPTTV